VLFGQIARDRPSVELLSLGSLNVASVCARAAVDALVSVDLVLAVSLVDSLGGAVLSASAAGDAIIANLVCHCSFLHTYLLTSRGAEVAYRLLYHKLRFLQGVTDNFREKSLKKDVNNL
jgi:3-oxoacyl-ACP reductase-like protein